MLSHWAAHWLSKKIKARVEVQYVHVKLLNELAIGGLYIEDKNHDTLLYAGEARVRLTDWFVFAKKPVLHYLVLNNTYARLNRNPLSDEWNYDFIIDAFTTNDRKTKDTSANFEFDLETVELNNVRFHMDDGWSGEDLDLDVGKLHVDTRDLDFSKKKLDINSIELSGTTFNVREYRPSGKKRKSEVDSMDSSPFNPDHWQINVNVLNLTECKFAFKGNDKVPVAGQFDENHLIINKINTQATGIAINDDTLRGKLIAMHAEERCGLKVEKLSAKVSVSPVAAICEQLYLETNRSKLGNYYAMHYRRFPDFLEYIDNVKMVAHLRNSTVDMKDIAYFAPQLRELPMRVTMSGDGKGTVANFNAQKLVISDGINVVKGDLAMAGLPDINKTRISYTSGEIFTNGSGVLKYFSELDSSRYIDVKKVTHAYFKGGFDGYIERFAVQGSLTTNLGYVEAKAKMNWPGFKSRNATYEGEVITSDAVLGSFFRQPLLGAVSAHGVINGVSFDPEYAQLAVNGQIDEMELNGYNYQQITAKGTLSKKHFDGALLVDDPNLALNFNGSLDYNEIKKLKLNANGQLLYANLKTLNLVGDSITASADFDMDFTGSDIDNFLGYARMYNVDARRGVHRIDVDSINLSSEGDDTQKHLTINSNLLKANVSGTFLLSRLHTSIQYYLSKYIPSYIAAPLTYPPDQNFTFSLVTRNIDSLWGVTIPFIKGFDSTTISGALNTTNRTLSLKANIPYGCIGKIHLSGVAIAATGDFDKLALNANCTHIYFFDSSVNSSLSLTTSVGNDSMDFTIATTSPDSGSAIELNGHITARHDSLYMTIDPSQFYLNRVKWDIAGGSKVAYSKKYFDVQQFVLSSGVQKISLNSQLEDNDNRLLVALENLDLAQLNNYENLASYQFDGRLNGVISVEKIFDELNINSNVRALNVKLGNDTVGVININGYYNNSKKTVYLDPLTGIYRDNATITASGTFVFDTTAHAKLDGSITFRNANLTWCSPFLTGVFSNIRGVINGDVRLMGTASNPNIKGELALKDAGFKLDFMGCTYSIPAATIELDNRQITWGSVTLYDRYGNNAYLTGNFTHNLFNRMRMHLNLSTPKFEVMKLTASDNNLFYGNVIASMDSFTIRGAFDDVRLHAYNAAPAANSHIFIPVIYGGDINTYSYVTFKSYGKKIEEKREAPFKMTLNIDATLNSLAEMTIVLDPATGDAITARGEGNIQLSMPPNNDMRINGTYVINQGTYDFTFRELFYRQFQLNAGSTITFSGPFERTEMNVTATYSKKARLYDLLNEAELKTMDATELTDAKTSQTVNILMTMRGALTYPQLSFNLDLPEKRSVGTYAYTKLQRINLDERQKFDQVGSFLLINSFIPSDGLGSGATAGNAIVNNVSQVFTKGASLGLTTLVNKLIGDNKLNVDLNYNTYSFSDQLNNNANYSRNRVKIGVSHPFLNDQLVVEVGSTSDWGRPVSSSNTTTNFNITGDFRVQYLLKQPSGLRLNAFRTSDYDVTLDKDITRSGVGLTWRKSFDNLHELFHSTRYQQQEREKIRSQNQVQDTGSR